jgi:hypothetical protein
MYDTGPVHYPLYDTGPVHYIACEWADPVHCSNIVVHIIVEFDLYSTREGVLFPTQTFISVRISTGECCLFQLEKHMA